MATASSYSTPSPDPSAPDTAALTRSAWDALIADREKLGLPDLTVVPIADFLRSSGDPAKNADILPSTQWGLVLDQAAVLLGNLYPHLPFKRQDFQSDPLGLADALRPLLQQSPPVMSELDFHIEMLKIFASVRDPHTAYVLPRYFHGAVAFLPFRAGFYDDADAKKRRFIVTAVMKGFDHPTFKPGVELVSCTDNIETEVEKAASLSPGANDIAQLQRGVLRLTVRPLATSGSAGWREPFEDETAAVTYLVPGSDEHHFIGFPWGVANSNRPIDDFPSGAFSMSSDLFASHYAASVFWNRQERYDAVTAQTSTLAPDPGGMSHFPDVFEFQTTGGISTRSAIGAKNLAADTAPEKQFGYIAIKRFNTSGLVDIADDLPAEFQRILTIMNQKAPDGLIVDIRNNPGGDIVAAEKMLQMLTPKPVTPANFHLAFTPATVSVLKTAGAPLSPARQLRAWASATSSPTADSLTTGHPLTPDANGLGQIYQGPVALLVDALTYSAADIFAGGFADNGIGPIIGSDASTGGGGASLWTHGDLLRKFQPSDLNLQPLPAGISMSLAFLRSSRVNSMLDRPIEDIGVQPGIVIPRTLNDLLCSMGNPVMSDLITSACNHLASMTPHRIEIANVVEVENGFRMSLTAVNIERLEFILDSDDSPVLAIPAAAANQPVVVPFHRNGVRPIRIAVRGNSADDLLASIRIQLGAPDSPDGDSDGGGSGPD